MTDVNGTDAFCQTEDDLEGSMLLAITAKKASQMLMDEIEVKATEYGDLRTMEALRKTLDRIAP